MSSTDTAHKLTRQELYKLIWTTPMRTLAPKYGLSDVGLGKICKKFNIPKPPVGYWAKLEHGKRVRKPKLPAAPAELGEDIVLSARNSVVQRKPEPQPFFDESLARLAKQVQAGEITHEVPSDLRGASLIARNSRDALKSDDRKAHRDRWGVWQQPERFKEPHVLASVAKENRQRAVLLIDALVKTMDSLGCDQLPPPSEWDRSVVFQLGTFRFRLRIRERTKRVKHELTAEEQRDKERFRFSFAPRYDTEYAGDFFVELLYVSSTTSLFQIKDGKRVGLVESRVADVAIGVLRCADNDLRRSHDRKLQEERWREEEQRRKEREEAERLETERREEERRRQDQLLSLAEDWRQATRLREFLLAFEQRLDGDPESMGSLEQNKRFLNWARGIADALDPLGRVHDLAERCLIGTPASREGGRSQ